MKDDKTNGIGYVKPHLCQWVRHSADVSL